MTAVSISRRSALAATGAVVVGGVVGFVVARNSAAANDHGSIFDAATGKVDGGPAPRPLPRVQITIRGGEVYPA